MSITTIRHSDTDVQVEQTLYTFAAKSDADAFQRCVADTAVDHCCQQHPPASTRSAIPDEPIEDPDRGSTISPKVGGMPL
ncbi:hypothetical protein [Paraburkholderia rhizosphaerae]|uniref:Uncharacterized protein n=1 Tax=Paraburkholderia rhizosphaerae TaxID=480658 RepID=A0A4R8L9I1_9BURK|nr:hypothetical protein [Paraburkholderia rhizosphaerae]TDY39055.1 hypothetical protein BX592_12859 [Paraburkholderia rhizosphaerae]